MVHEKHERHEKKQIGNFYSRVGNGLSGLVSHVEFARRVAVILSVTKNLLFMAVKISTVHNEDKKQILRCTQNDKTKIVPNKSSMTDQESLGKQLLI